METFLLYGALVIAQIGLAGKQFAMKRCGAVTPGPFNSVCINMARSLICLIVSLIIWLIMDRSGTTLFGNIIIIAAGVGTAFNLFTWILASRLVSLTLIECLFMVGSLVVPLILTPYIYDGERVSVIQWIGCALVFGATILFMDTGKKAKNSGGGVRKIIILTVATVSITVASVLRKYYTFHITENGLGSVEYFTFISFVTVLAVFAVLFVIYYLLEKNKATAACQSQKTARVEFPYKRVWIYILIAAVSLYVNELFSSYSSALPAAIFYPLSKGLGIGVTFLLDAIVFKDKVTVRKIFGLITIAAAIVLVNL